MITVDVKLLVQGLAGLIAVVGFSLAYADDSSILDAINKQQTTTLEAGVKNNKPQNIRPDTNAALQNSIPNLKDTTLSSKPSLPTADKNKSPKVNNSGVPKTHYGIGYEFRKKLQILRGQTLARPEKTQRPERLERAQRIDRPERVNRPERPQRIDRPERHGR